MSDYKILYVDEVAADRHAFQLYIARSDTDKEFAVSAWEPDPNLEDFVDRIINENFDAVITDHKLSEENPEIEYDGLQLVDELLSRRLSYPSFILTSFDDEAVRDGEDVNIVYIKGLMMSEEGHKATFIDKIKYQIKHHQAKIKSFQDEYDQLVNQEKLNSQEEDRLLELDSTLEKMINKPLSIPARIKMRSYLDDLHKMITNTDKLIDTLSR